MITKFKKGDMVQSTYRSFWHGIVLDVDITRVSRHRVNVIYTIQQLYTVDGREQRIKRICKLNEHWLRHSTITQEYE